MKRIVKDWFSGAAGAGLLLLALTLAVMCAATPVALAAPNGIFARFAQCPTERSSVTLCLHAELVGGMFAIGKVSVPITRTLIVQDGTVPTGGPNLNEYFLSAPVNGQSIPPNELEIPGGMKAILQCPQTGCRGPSGNVIPNAVFATIETAASPANPGILDLAAAVEERGPTLTLPVRIQLHNSLLGSACYLGSTAHPIELRATTGTTNPPLPNKPITGKTGRVASVFENGYELTALMGAELVDNAFSVPVAQGCGGQLAWLIDVEIDQALGLESTPGHNTGILMGAIQLAEVEAVLASAAFPSK